MTRHSAVVGGSTAGRLLECPGSWAATIALPDTSDKSSEYAEEGTFAHAVMDNLMRLRQASGGNASLHVAAGDLIGETFHDRKLTIEHLDTMIYPALYELEALEDAYGSDFRVLGVEQRVAFPGIPGAFGTCDLILGSKTHILHVDWKFGSGVGVKASYVDSEGERLNPQMMFYLTAAMNSLKALYKGTGSRGQKRELVIAIIQPRGMDPLTHTVVTRQDIKWFTEDLQNAVVAALDPAPPRARGEHCRFAPCKIDCPLWTGPMLDLAAMKLVPRTEVVTREPSPYGDYLARAKALVDILDQYKKEVDEQLHAYLEDGGTVPGWKLKHKVKQRQWVDEDVVENELHKLGFAHDDIWQKKLQTFQRTDAVAKKLGVKIPDHLRVAPPSNETTVTTADDPAPPVDRALAIEQFAASIPLRRKG